MVSSVWTILIDDATRSKNTSRMSMPSICACMVSELHREPPRLYLLIQSSIGRVCSIEAASLLESLYAVDIFEMYTLRSPSPTPTPTVVCGTTFFMFSPIKYEKVRKKFGVGLEIRAKESITVLCSDILRGSYTLFSFKVVHALTNGVVRKFLTQRHLPATH